MIDYWARFVATASRFPDRPAIIVHGAQPRRLSYSQLEREADRQAERLAAAGLGAGGRCAILAENSPDWIAASLGILRLNAVAVPLDRAHPAEVIVALLRDSGASVCLCSAGHLETCRQVAAQVPDLQVMALEPDANVGDAEGALPAHVEQEEAPALILYTSGTSGIPKGVVLTHKNILAAVDGMTQVLSLSERDSVLGMLPLFHILAQVSTMYLPLSVGGLVVLLEQVNAGEIVGALRERRITILCSVPQFFYLIHERIQQQLARMGAGQRGAVRAMLGLSGFARDRLGLNPARRLFRKVHESVGPDLRLLVSAGAAFDPSIARSLHRFGFTVLQAYGLTETTGAATVTPPGDNRIGSVGRPIPAVAVAVLDAEGKPCPNGEEGEVAIRGPTVSPGYHGRPDVTAASRRDGWFMTGDLGMLDESGHLSITGRSKDMIVLDSGKKIYPEEIERALDRSHYIKEACVLGRKVQREGTQSEMLHAVIVPDMAVMKEERIVNLAEQIRHEVESVSAQLPTHQRIMGFDLSMEELPRTSTRKIRRFMVLERFGADRGGGAASSATEPERPRWSEADLAWAGRPLAAALLALLKERSPAHPPEVHPNDSIELDLGFDSLRRIELVVEVQQRLGIDLEHGKAIECYSVRDLVEATVDAQPADYSAGEARPAGLGWPQLLDAGGEAAAVPRLAGPLLDGVRFAVAKLVRGTAAIAVRLDVKGLDNLPRDRPFILAANHQSFLDGFLLLSALPYRTTRKMVLIGRSEYFNSRATAWIADRFNVAVVDSDANLVQAMQVAAGALKADRPLLVFPEGARTIDGEIRPLRRGAAILACHLRVPIVPLVLDGPGRIWPRGQRFQGLSPVTLRFLAAIDPGEAEGAAFDDATAAMTAELEQRMRSCLAEIRFVAS